MAALGLGLIGCGRLAERGYVDAIRRARGVRLAALADSDRGRRERLAGGLPAYADAAELVEDDRVEALIVATPAAAHLEGAVLASTAGLPALVEKPPAADLDGAIAMLELERPPVLGFNRRFEPAMVRLRSRVPLGAGLEITLTLHHTGAWAPYVASDDALMALGPHLIDLTRWLTGSEVEEVRALELGRQLARLELGLGRGRALVSCATSAQPADEIEVHRNGGAVTGYSAGGPLRRGMRRLCRPLGAGALVRSLARQLEAFASAAGGNQVEALGTADDGIAVMRVIEAARRSHDSGGGRRSVVEPAPAAR